MRTLNRRIAKLECATEENDLVVLLQRCGSGDNTKITGPGDQVVIRVENETEDDFIGRAADEIVARVKAESGAQPCYVLRAYRDSQHEVTPLVQIFTGATRD